MVCKIHRVRKKTSAEAGVFPKILPVWHKNTEKQVFAENKPDDESQPGKSFIFYKCNRLFLQSKIQDPLKHNMI